MRTSIQNVTLGLAVMALGSVAVAQTSATSTKTAPGYSLLEKSYGSIELRHENDVYATKGEIDNQVPNVSVRPTVGTGLFNDKVDTSFTWIFHKDAGSDYVKRTAVYNYTTISAYSSDLVYVTPNFFTYQNVNDGDSWNTSYVGIEVGNKTTMETTIGSFAFQVYDNPGALLKSSSNKTTQDVATRSLLDNDKPALKDNVEESDETIDQREASIWNEAAAYVTYTPATMQKLSVKTGLMHYRQWDPKYIQNDVDGAIEKDGYNVSAETLTRLSLSYKLSDSLTLSNTFYHYTIGFYEEGKDDANGDTGAYTASSKRMENRISLNATLF